LSDILALFLIFLVVLNPPGVLLTWRSLSGDLETPGQWWAAAGGLVLAIAGLLVAAVFGDDLIDALDVSLSSFQVGAGLLLILGVLRVFVTRNPWTAPAYDGRLPEAVAGLRLGLWLATPAALAAAAFYGADRGEVETATALAGAIAVCGIAVMAAHWVTNESWLLVLREAGRALAVVLIVIAIDLIFDGITRV
jgi:small neutral amino acid transporter SnatA (MarC family)